MVSIRNILADDVDILHENLYMNMSQSDILKMITDWNKKEYQNRFFEMFAIVFEQHIVGTVSLYQHEGEVISAGMEIFSQCRRCGYAGQGTILALKRAKEMGYRVAVAQVKKNNTASIALHKKLGFVIDHDYVNKNGNEVWFLIKPL